jgi:hypothetical protein
MYPLDAAFFERVFGAKEYFRELSKFEEPENPSIEDRRKIELKYLAVDYLKKYALVI